MAICWKAPCKYGRFREIPTSHDLTSTTMVAYNIKSTSVAMLHAIIAPRDDTIRICQYTKIILKTIYCPLLIKSFDHEGWVVGVAVRANRLYLAIKSVGTSTKCTDEKQLYSHSRILPLLSWHDATTQLRSRRCVAIL